MSVDYKSRELNIYSNEGGVFRIYDDTGGVPGLAPTTQVMRLKVFPKENSVNGYALVITDLFTSVNGFAASVGWNIGDLQSKASASSAGLALEIKDRKSAVDALNVSLANEAKARSDADGIHTSAIAQEVYDRQAGDQANLGLINQEVADRKAAVSVVTSATVANALAISDEKTRALTAEDLLNTAIADEKTRAMSAEGVLSSGLSDEKTRALSAEGKLSNQLDAEIKRAVEKEAKLDARIDFLTSNSDPVALDSLTEIVNQFSTNGMGYADRLTYLEGVVAALVNKSQ